MKASHIITTGIVLAVLVAVISLWQSGDSGQYKAEIQKSRQEKVRHFKVSDDSPIEDTADFKGLSFFPVNRDWRVHAELRHIDDPETIHLTTPRGKTKTYLKYARARFTLKGREHQLLLLKNYRDRNQNQLFLPFTDQTNGQQTYKGGRYLDIPLPRPNPSEVVIDFNKAYNPFCVYNKSYVCPIPPSENHLNIAIKAGEKLPSQ